MKTALTTQSQAYKEVQRLRQKTAEVQYIESGAFQGNESEVEIAGLEEGEECLVVSKNTFNRLAELANAAASIELLAALEKAKETIQAWHGDVDWNTYDTCSPEMQIINAAISKAKGEA